ncbi:DUF4189 domain-containing protein [Mesorhizobium sp. AR07]|uniref:DUF4189 domain-containing protein n=1 Tax=Mesorhizobium sp. AR07 TaxID=2865838 RepID=UPI00215FA81E|nr:DUF4189 domain-containing protein [Mesorhizobium sp. AR07]UVK46382.1 DUF4189 domain-containing protein [Mesorhizobium sp. AR07]
MLQTLEWHFQFGWHRRTQPPPSRLAEDVRRSKSEAAMKRLYLMLGCLLLGLLPAGSTLAAGAVFLGDDESYGWCSGYTSREAARKCALEQCKEAEGVNCQLALECQGRMGRGRHRRQWRLWHSL